MDNPKIWAILIGINDYGSPSLNLRGCAEDVKRIRGCLKAMDVPESNIRLLEDTNATRENIIKMFQEHFIHNENIIPGDALYLHYSGHGSQVNAPDEWRTSGDVREDLVEVIVPFDSVVRRNSEGAALSQPLSGIPDRTLKSLARTAHTARKTTNITFVLDCCHSGHMLRGANSRYIEAREVGRTNGTTDLDTWGPYVARGAFTEGANDHYTLLAASTRYQTAKDHSSGGYFTSSWANILQRDDLYRLSYRKAMTVIQEQFTAKPYLDQTPQLETKSHDRIVFRNRFDNPRIFAVRPRVDGTVNSGRSIEIAAGAIHGVQRGFHFDVLLSSSDEGSAQTTVPVIVTDVLPTACVAEAPSLWTPEMASEASFLAQKATATFRCSLAYAFTHNSSNPQSRIRDRILQLLATSEHTSVQESMANVLLHITETYVEIRNQAPTFRQLRIPPTRLPLTSSAPNVLIDALPVILDKIALFNLHLEGSPANPKPSESALVEFALHELPPKQAIQAPTDGSQGSHDGNSGMYATPTGLRKEATPDGEYIFSSTSLRNTRFGIVLRNRTSRDFYAYTLFFNPSNYAIDIHSSPLNEDQPNLPKDPGFLQVGDSAEHDDAFMLDWTAEEGNVDSTWLKVFISTEATTVASLEQDSIFEPQTPSTYDRSHVQTRRGSRKNDGSDGTAARWQSVPTQLWGSFIHLITVEKEDKDK
ncbi:caspase domain-containing protein [Amylostereum chailletii]|nr:caspase domain-containing protein [Amylostereum chailletii]